MATVPLFLALVVLAAAELAVIVEVAVHIGVLLTIVILLLISASGPFLVRRVGFGVWKRANSRARAGEIPGRELRDGVLLLAAGVLICIPGFITDAVGLLLLLPPTRDALSRATAHYFRRRITGRVYSSRPVVDVTTRDADTREELPPR